MSKKALLHIPVSEGGLLPDSPEIKTLEPEVKASRDIEYMTVADYSTYINRPTTVIYRMIRENELESVKIGGKIHVILNYKA